MRADHPVQGALRGELVGRGLERRARHRRDLRRHLVPEPGRGVEPGTDGGSSHGQPEQATGGVLDLGDRIVEGTGVARPLLAHGQRGGVLEVRSPDLDYLSPLPRLALDGVAEPLQGRDGLPRGHLVRGDMHGRREGVVARLAHVHVIVGVHRPLGAERPADKLDAAVRDDLVHVHVGLGTRARLPDIQREILIQSSAHHLVAHPLDQLAFPVGQAAGPGVHHRSGLLHVAVGVVHLFRHPVVADVEVLEAALGLRTPVPVGRHFDVAEAVELPARAGGIEADRHIEDLRGLLRGWRGAGRAAVSRMRRGGHHTAPPGQARSGSAHAVPISTPPDSQTPAPAATDGPFSQACPILLVTFLADEQ